MAARVARGGPRRTIPIMAEQKSPPTKPAPMVWIDTEMSGLDPETCAILEIAILVTDGDLVEVGGELEVIVHQPDAVLDAMDDWCTRQHGASGLTQAVKDSTTSLAEAEAMVLAFLAEHTERGTSPLCGNSVGQDKRFLEQYMPAVVEFLHYRVIDVSTVKELARRWYPDLAPFDKGGGHRALDDIRESIGELRYFRERVFRDEPLAIGEAPD